LRWSTEHLSAANRVAQRLYGEATAVKLGLSAPTQDALGAPYHGAAHSIGAV